MRTTILLIEANDLLRSGLSKVLGLKNFNVIGAEDGWVGLQLAKHLQPDLILCDINMPNINGYGLLHIIRSEATTAKTPFIFMTSRSDPANRSQAMELGANDYVKKGGKLTRLLQAIAQQIDAVRTQ
ncbi:MAG: response regulator [Hormoscilla sp.]